METRTKLVAVEYNDNGSCKKALIVKNLTETDYKKLVDESLVSKEHGKQKASEINKRIANCEIKLTKHELCLAKSIYDNFVDRGLIEDDDEFQKSWYDFVFKGTGLTGNLPSEFLQIVEFIAKEN